MRFICLLLVISITLFFMLTAPALALFGLFEDNGIAFDITLEGVKPSIADRYNLEDTAREALNPDNPPETRAELDSMTGVMAERMRAKLEAYGYMQARVRGDLKPLTKEEKAEEITPMVIFQVDLATRYRIGSSHIDWENPEDAALLDEQQFQMEEGKPLIAEDVLEVAADIESYLTEHYCFLSLEVNPSYILDRKEHLAEVMFHVKHGQQANFGDTYISGNTSINEDVLRHYLQWERGQCYRKTRLDATQNLLLRSQLVASSQVAVADTPDAEGNVPVTLNITERKHRTIGAGASFGTDEGFGVNARWEHRNLFHDAHRFTARTRINDLEKTLAAEYRIPFFYDNRLPATLEKYLQKIENNTIPDRQSLVISSQIREETTDTFDSLNISGLVQLQRHLTPDVTIGVGGGARLSSIEEIGREREEYGLVYLPAFVEWDTRDNPTDARDGFLLRGSVSPYADVTGQSVNFTKLEGLAQTYLTAEEMLWEPTLALRFNYGQINGATASDIPADLRFYSGGGGSVRGYDFRALGPRIAGEPAGGTILTEGSAELRLHFTQEYGGVVFVDAGNVYDESLPSFGEGLFYSVGMGARYFSPVGPIRLDVGVPVSDVEDGGDFGVYISIGQAF